MPEVRRSYLGGLTMLFDNDLIAGNDNRYTAGLSFAWTSLAHDTYGRKSVQRKILDAFSFLPVLGGKERRRYLQLILGTEMYTASDITLADPPPDDHPYAGVLYLDGSLFSRGPRSSHQLTLRLGLVGPMSGAEQIQKWLHEIIDSPRPEAWDTQLGNEPIVNLFYQYGRRLLQGGEPDCFAYDLTVNGGGGAGTYYTGANLGFMVRVGYRLPDTYGATPLLGGAEPVVGLDPAPKRFYAYLFLSAQGFGVLRFLPVDGNTFRESRSGERDAWLANVSAGGGIGYGRFLVGYCYHGITGLSDLEVVRGQRADDFGTLGFTVFFG